MSGSGLSKDRHADVIVVRWADGENRFGPDSVANWHELLDEIERDDPSAVVITGDGKYFSCGLDLERLAQAPHQALPTVAGLQQLMARLLLLPRYVAAAINGHAYAGGAMFSCCTDLRVMRSDRGYWCLPEADLGLAMTSAMASVVTAKLPAAAAHEAILTGRRYTATEAHAAGIVHTVTNETDVLNVAIEQATAMATKAPEVLGTHKRLLFGQAAQACGFVEASMAGAPARATGATAASARTRFDAS